MKGTIGFDKPLYTLSCHHRGLFQTKLFGWKVTSRPASG